MKKPALYIILDKQYCHTRSVLEWAELLIQAKVDLVQYRNKRGAAEEVLEEAKALSKRFRQSPIPFILNDDPYLAQAAQADGVHLGQEDAAVQTARKVLGPGEVIGVSTRSMEQAVAAVQQGADYLAVGALFPSKTKQTAVPTPLKVLEQIANHVSVPVYGIGGVTLGNRAKVLESGAHGVAVSRAVLNAPDPLRWCRLYKV